VDVAWADGDVGDQPAGVPGEIRASPRATIRVRISRSTLDRWIADWHKDGFDALVPSPRQSAPRTPAEVTALATALKQKKPGRTAAQIRRILLREPGVPHQDRRRERRSRTRRDGSGRAQRLFSAWVERVYHLLSGRYVEPLSEVWVWMASTHILFIE
jgi:hypothetical protein